jgi:Nucleotidyl transferase AbiEii toxin, Type IV TA system
MAIAESYRKQVALLIRTVPLVAAEKEFALKGGTAINLFVRDMPRLSVDIDLTYVPVAEMYVSPDANSIGAAGFDMPGGQRSQPLAFQALGFRGTLIIPQEIVGSTGGNPIGSIKYCAFGRPVPTELPTLYCVG